MASLSTLLLSLLDRRVEFVLVGGMAARVHGSATVTEDLDICAPFEPENMGRLLEVLEGLHPRWRFHPDHPPLEHDARGLSAFRNLYLNTDLGPLDVLGSLTGIGGYSEVARHVIHADLAGRALAVLAIDALIVAKTAAAREKDRRALPELEALRRRIRERERGG